MVVFATLSAVPVVVMIVLLVPGGRVTVPPPVALKPAPLVVSMSRSPPVKLIVAPVLLVRSTAALAPRVQHLGRAVEGDRAAGVVVMTGTGVLRCVLADRVDRAVAQTAMHELPPR